MTPNWGNFSLFFEAEFLLGACFTPDMIDIAAMSLVGDWMDTCLPDEEVAGNIQILEDYKGPRDSTT